MRKLSIFEMEQTYGGLNKAEVTPNLRASVVVSSAAQSYNEIPETQTCAKGDNDWPQCVYEPYHPSYTPDTHPRWRDFDKRIDPKREPQLRHNSFRSRFLKF